MPSEQKKPEFELSAGLKHASDPTASEPERPRWSKPEITSFKPITDAEGINIHPSDGISNLTIN